MCYAHVRSRSEARYHPQVGCHTRTRGYRSATSGRQVDDHGTTTGRPVNIAAKQAFKHTFSSHLSVSITSIKKQKNNAPGPPTDTSRHARASETHATNRFASLLRCRTATAAAWTSRTQVPPVCVRSHYAAMSLDSKGKIDALRELMKERELDV